MFVVIYVLMRRVIVYDIFFGFHHRDVTFIYILVIQTNKIYMIKDNKSNQLSLICYIT